MNYGPETFRAKDGRLLEIRHCTPHDAASFRSLRETVAKESTHTMQYVGQNYEPEANTALRWAKVEASACEVFLGAFAGTELVALLGLHAPWSDHPWGKHVGQFGMMVRESYWGQGLGFRLLRAMDELAARAGLERIEAMVRPGNARGLKLYEKAGFQIEGTRRSAAFIDDKFVDDYFIAKLYGKAKTASDNAERRS